MLPAECAAPWTHEDFARLLTQRSLVTAISKGSGHFLAALSRGVFSNEQFRRRAEDIRKLVNDWLDRIGRITWMKTN